MKTVSELTDFYYKTLYPPLQKLENERKKLRYRIIMIAVFYIVIALVFGLSFSNSSYFSPHILAIFGVGHFSFGVFLYKWLLKDYTQEFKTTILGPLIKAIDEKLSYWSEMHVSELDFNKSELFTQKPDRFSGNDFVSGEIDGVKIQFSDIHAQKRHKNSKGQESLETLFQGLFIVSEFNKNFHGKTIVLADTAQKTFGSLLGNWLQSKNTSRDELVKMDDNNFEKEFVVYSTDQIEARYILSHALMTRLLNFQQKSQHPVYVSFIGGTIYIAIYHKKDLFEPSVFHSLLEYKIAMEYVKTLHLALGIVEELKLNQKLWSKR